MDYQLPLEPFGDPDLFDAYDEEPIAPGLFVATNQQGNGMLDFEVERVARQSSKLELPRPSMSGMVDLALDQGYASSIGDLLDQISAYRQYKLFNGLLAVLQRPHPVYLLTAEQWQTRWRRTIRRGEHPIVLLVRHGPLMFLFDVSQTESKDGSRELPGHLQNPFAMRDVVDATTALTSLAESAKSHGVRVNLVRDGWRSAGCIEPAVPGSEQVVVTCKAKGGQQSVPVRWEVDLNDALRPTERLATLSHELGHLYCGHMGAQKPDPWINRNPSHEVREFESESVAILVFRRLAPEAVLPPYLDQYFRPGQPLPTDGWDRVVRAASRIVDMCQGSKMRT